MKVGSRESVRIIPLVVERRLRHIERVEYQLAQQRLPTPSGAKLFDHVTGDRVDYVVVRRPRPEVKRRVHVSDGATPRHTRDIIKIYSVSRKSGPHVKYSNTYNTEQKSLKFTENTLTYI